MSTSARFQEIDRRPTPMGEISVRRRLEPTLLVDVFEVKLDDEHLMSNLFTAAEIALADLALAQLDHPELDVVEALDAVIDWHEHGLLPNSAELTSDPRCHLVHGDFFAIVADNGSFGPDGRDRYHAILLDIDHTPTHVLDPSNASFYTADGLGRLTERLHPGGVFALWSDTPDDSFLATARTVFATCHAHEVRFPNPHTGGEATNTVYVARTTSP